MLGSPPNGPEDGSGLPVFELVPTSFTGGVKLAALALDATAAIDTAKTPANAAIAALRRIPCLPFSTWIQPGPSRQRTTPDRKTGVREEVRWIAGVTRELRRKSSRARAFHR